jgi:hypothetical protein
LRASAESTEGKFRIKGKSSFDLGQCFFEPSEVREGGGEIEM